MCGLIGYKGQKNAAAIVINGLKHLEYRGYDSAGLCLISKNKAVLIKKVGKVEKLLEEITRRQVKGEILEGEIGIGHTRWSTHGAVTEVNAHPHFSCDKNIYVVHNGIIENYQELKKDLIKKGHHFVSQTDTEVIPHLIEEYKKSYDFKTSCLKTFRQLKGLFAVVVLDSRTGEIIGARNGSPLVMGIAKDGLFLASDIPAFLDKANKIILIDDEEMIYLKNDRGYLIKNFMTNKIIKKKVQNINWTFKQAEKGKYPHFMIKEIMEIPGSIRNALIQNKKIINKITQLISKSSQIIFVGCGTAGHACLEAKYLFSAFGIKSDFIPASEFINFLPSFNKNTLIIAISQSGETIDVVEAVRLAKSYGLKVAAIVNVMGSTLTRISDYVLMINAGPEKCVLATKSYLGQLTVILFLLSFFFNQISQDKIKILSQLSSRILTDINFHKRIKTLAKLLKNRKHLYVIGRGFQYPTSLETALKIKEGCYLHTEAFAGGELKHGVIALIEKDTPCIVHLAEDNQKENTLINAMELKSRGAYLIGIGPKKIKEFDYFVEIPQVDAIFAPLINIIPVQLLTYYLAIEGKIDPDRPRHLAKSVTVK